MELWQLKQMQSLPLEVKIQKSLLRIREWYENYDGQVYISFSGGKDSTVLLYLVRSIYPDVEAVFSDTGLEFPEIKDFVKSINNVTWLKPKLSFRQVIEQHGYPIISKDVMDCIEGALKGQKYRIDRLDGTLKNKDGGKSRYDRTKYAYLLEAPFKVSNQCCNEMKKKPFKQFEKKTGKKAITGIMADESQLRTSLWLKTGCNAFENKRPMSQPLSFWTEKDIWNYIKTFNIPYSPIYDMGYKRTGCVFCAFGAHLEKGTNRFQRLQKTHPQLWEYCVKDWSIGGLGMSKVLDYIGVEYKDPFIGQVSLFDLAQ